MLKRIFPATLPYDGRSMADFRRFCQHEVRHWCTRNDVARIDVPEHEAWLAGLGKRRSRYEREIEEDGYQLRALGGTVKAHIKIELLPEPKAPRIIQARNDHYQYQIGPWIHAIEHRLRDAREPFLIKGLRAPEVADRLRAALDQYRDPIVVETDYTAFDATIGRPIAEACQHAWFKHLVPDHIADFIMRTHSFKGRAPSGSPYSATMRASGDPHTSIGNAVINYSVARYVARTSGVVSTTFVEGDDGFTIIERNDQAKWSTGVYGLLGLNVKIAFREPVDAVFCSRTLWLRGDGHWTVIRSPSRILSKVQWTTSPLAVSRKHGPAVRRGMAICAYLECRGIPVLQDFGLMLLRHTDAAVVPEFGDARPLEWLNFMEFEPIPVSDDARQFFYERTGICIDDQVSVEQLFSEDLPSYEHPALYMLFQQ